MQTRTQAASDGLNHLAGAALDALEIEDEPAPVQRPEPIRLTPTQEDFANRIVAMHNKAGGTQDVATLTGYAGTGKTTTVASALGRIANGKDCGRIVAAAPTHKALAVLASKLPDTGRIEFATVHSLLGLSMQETDEGTHKTTQSGKEPSLREFTLAVIDESSMIGDEMFAMILALRGFCRVLFVGDSAQLPPVGAKPGTVSSTFNPERVAYQWQLTEVLRQAKENPVLRAATMLRQRIESGQPTSLFEIGQDLRPGDDDQMTIAGGNHWNISEMVADAVKQGFDVRSLAFDNRSVQSVNQMVHGILYPGEGPYVAGEPLMAQESFEAYGLTDGDPDIRKKVQILNSQNMVIVEGTDPVWVHEFEEVAYILIVRLDSGDTVAIYAPIDHEKWQSEISAKFKQARELKLEIEGLPNGPDRIQADRDRSRLVRSAWELRKRYAPIRHAYAMTVHKAQGSTFQAVIVDWASFERCRDVSMRNRLAYVALTRTSEYTVLFAGI